MSQKDSEIIRKRQTKSEDRLDRSWMPQGDWPVLAGGNIHYQISDRLRAVDCGGLGLVQILVKKLRLAESIDQRVKVLQRHLPYRESDHVLNLIYNVMSGGNCLQDLEARRRDVSYLDALGAHKVPAPSTEGDFLRRFEGRDVEDLMEAVNEARLKVWGKQKKSFRRLATIDVDGTMAPTQGECKEGIGLNYKGQWGYHPLVVSLAETNEVLYLLNRPGNRPSHEDAAGYLDRAVGLARRGGFKKVLLRGDTDFTQSRHLDRWSKDGVQFVFGMDANRWMVRRAEQLSEKSWKKLTRKKKRKGLRRRRANVKRQRIRQAGYRNLELAEEHTAEFEHRPERCRQTYRVVVLRKRVRVKRGQRRLFDQLRYLFYITNLRAQDKSSAQVVFTSNRRCAQENVNEQLKNGVQAMRMPSDTLESNWAYLVIAAQAWNLKAWLGLLQLRQGFGRQLLTMEFRRFLRQVVQLPCQIVRQGRRLIYRFLGVNQWTEAFLEGALWLKRMRFG